MYESRSQRKRGGAYGKGAGLRNYIKEGCLEETINTVLWLILQNYRIPILPYSSTVLQLQNVPRSNGNPQLQLGFGPQKGGNLLECSRNAGKIDGREKIDGSCPGGEAEGIQKARHDLHVKQIY
ncbi:hypothetical protein B9Z55_021624 [Caenorhabditis nigoni]|uniref:Uncharacterized protein n=1 Tax=Caenorhabditis nigoni TaxID=1611254 RepID=A0A2G5TSS8_9PELO|nr:hypothetical protein B9Z55_021624 [Caenorhabditis nigoni]